MARIFYVGASKEMAKHERPIEFENGLVDPSVLLEFMDDCHCDGLRPGLPVDHKLEYHHLYFPRPDYKGSSVDPAIRRLRLSRYNLVHMLSCQEDTYHQTVSSAVSKDQIDLDAANTFLEEVGWITDFAASSWMLADTRDRIRHNGSGTQTKKALQNAVLDQLEEKVEENGERVGHISVMHHTVVNGAMRRYLKQTPEPTAQAVFDNLGLEGPAVPIKIYDSISLEYLARTKLRRKEESMWWILRKTLPNKIVVSVPALQTGVNAV